MLGLLCPLDQLLGVDVLFLFVLGDFPFLFRLLFFLGADPGGFLFQLGDECGCVVEEAAREFGIRNAVFAVTIGESVNSWRMVKELRECTCGCGILSTSCRLRPGRTRGSWQQTGSPEPR